MDIESTMVTGNKLVEILGSVWIPEYVINIWDTKNICFYFNNFMKKVQNALQKNPRDKDQIIGVAKRALYSVTQILRGETRVFAGTDHYIYRENGPCNLQNYATFIDLLAALKDLKNEADVETFINNYVQTGGF